MDGKIAIESIEKLLNTILEISNKYTELAMRYELLELRLTNLEYWTQKGIKSDA